jgi:hypothetical protein
MKQETFKPSARLEQVLKTYNADYSADNKLTSEESEALMRLLRKALAPSSAMVIADTEESSNEAQGLANVSDMKMFDGGFSQEIAEEFTQISMELGFMLGDYMIKKGLEIPTEDILNEFNKENNLPPIFLSKGVVLSHFHSLFIKDPLTLLLNYKQMLQHTPEAATRSIMTAAAAYVAREGAIS